MLENIETVVVGGGQAGLAASYFLTQQGREHIVLEKAAQAGEAWRNHRWDSFTLVTPNWTFRLPGAEYKGSDPDGFMPRHEIVAYFEQYVERYHLPVRFNTNVQLVEKANGRYRVEANEAIFNARNVVIATGLFQLPKIPPYSANLPDTVLQLHSGEYRNPEALPPGAVLVIGSAQSGCQIAEELYQNGRQVYLSTCTAARAPRRYRGKDIVAWLALTDFFDRSADQMVSPTAKFTGNPLLTGKNGGHSLNLHQFYRDGVILLGRSRDIQDSKAYFAPDLMENLAKSDKGESEYRMLIDDYIADNGLDAPEEELPLLQDGYRSEVITELDLKVAGINTIIWAMGYRSDFSLVKLPVFDPHGYPIQKNCATAYPGLYFLGLPWLTARKSGLLLGVGNDAAMVSDSITGTNYAKG